TRDKVGSNAANVLGDATVTPLELTNAYATLAAQGMRSTPHIISNVVDARGNLVYLAPGADKRTPVFDADVMAATTYALSQVVQEGSGKPAQAIGRPAAGKTGTSTANKSAWFAGFTPGLATVVGLHAAEAAAARGDPDAGADRGADGGGDAGRAGAAGAAGQRHRARRPPGADRRRRQGSAQGPRSQVGGHRGVLEGAARHRNQGGLRGSGGAAGLDDGACRLEGTGPGAAARGPGPDGPADGR